MSPSKPSIFIVLWVVFGAQQLQAEDTAAPDMKCSDVRAVFDAADPDRQRVRDIVIVVKKLLDELDTQNAGKSRPRIYGRMSQEGKSSTISVVTARCDDHPEESLRTSATAVYGGIQAMGDEMGVNR